MTLQSFAYTPSPQGEFAHRPIVWGTCGMVGGGTPRTAQTGMRILWQGGNAVDAAVAAAFAAGVLEPTAHYSLGGEVACLFYDRSSQQVRSVVGQGWAPGPRPCLSHASQFCWPHPGDDPGRHRHPEQLPACTMAAPTPAKNQSCWAGNLEW